ncbi:MAG: polysaccharide pyruvyl transferase family protein [Candidatus Bipolaricaulota bacterium]
MTLYGYFGHGNLGDEAIREAWEGLLAPEWTVRPVAPPRFPRRGPTLFTGGILQDRTSRRSLLFYALAVRTASGRGPVALASVGVDVRSLLSRAVLRRVLPQAGYLSVRDPGSRAVLAGLGIPAREGRDPVLALPPVPRRGGGPVLVSLSPLVPEPLRTSALADARTVADRLGVAWVGLVMDRREDIAVLRGLPTVAPTNLQEASQVLSRACLLIGSRLHALELALVAGTPFLAVPCAPKVEEFLTLVERDLPAPVPRLPRDGGQWERVLSPDWARAQNLARERLRTEALEGVDDVRRWLRAVA